MQIPEREKTALEFIALLSQQRAEKTQQESFLTANALASSPPSRQLVQSVCSSPAIQQDKVLSRRAELV